MSTNQDEVAPTPHPFFVELGSAICSCEYGECQGEPAKLCRIKRGIMAPIDPTRPDQVREHPEPTPCDVSWPDQ